MSNWCNNRLVITGQSVFVDELQQWVNTFRRSVPDGKPRSWLTTSRAASTSLSAGDNRAIRSSPASVGVTLRVVR